MARDQLPQSFIYCLVVFPALQHTLPYLVSSVSLLKCCALPSDDICQENSAERCSCVDAVNLPAIVLMPTRNTGLRL